MLIYRALLKDGYSGFRLEILEYCSIEELIDREQFFIDSTNPEYNILKVAGSSAGFKHSEASKDLKSLLAQGRKFSPETLLKMKNGVVSEEAKAKISAPLKGIKVSSETTSRLKRKAILGRTFMLRQEYSLKKRAQGNT